MTEHGYIRYTHGCRCDICRTAKADYQRRKRAEARANAARHTMSNKGGRLNRVGIPRFYVPTAKHGSAASYVELGCRCWPCTDAMTRKRASETSRQRARLEQAS